MFLIANLVAYYAMKERAAEFGMTGDMLAKNDLVIDGGLRSLEICKRAGVPVAYGTRPARPAAGRADPASSCCAARCCRRSRSSARRPQSARSCCAWRASSARSKPGAFADMILVDGDPLKDLGLFQEQGKHLSVIMKGGVFHKNTLH